ncbi:T3SS effector HopA1 family protein [Rivularia sp. UHCC 0363]|uniref:T3SS effector HopA1 family protein n=1 Tax=Rivularia sp. UHCC 0363 TaxID=3110244 RepID=UPI002B1EA0A0|nr:T3SS effector HopA1 family protein [Rivularia sp. UHCC 0363]MEA5595855.1 T3SS effector HopA1 family protein [Rivularia sp. UHCC 0363]
MITSSKNSLSNTFYDIVSKIKIESNFSILHPDYQPFGLSALMAETLEKSSIKLQNKYLTLLVRNFLYGIYYNNSLQSVLAANTSNPNLLLHQDLENNCVFEIDREFYNQLHEYNRGTGYCDPDWQILRIEPDGSLAVTKAGLTLHVEESHLESTTTANINDLIAIRLPKNRLNNGFYLAVSNSSKKQEFDTSIFFNLNTEGTIALMDSLTKQLNDAEIAFNFQVPHHPLGCDRYDAGILNFQRQDYLIIQKLLKDIYTEHQSYFQPEIPLFAKFLAPGLSLAEQPVEKPLSKQSFGVNRCQIIANALFAAWEKDINSPEEKVNIIRQHFAGKFVDLERPYLNANSEDIYNWA